MSGLLDRVKFRATAGGTSDWTVSAALLGFQTPTLAGIVANAYYRVVAESDDLTQWEIADGLWNGTTFARTVVWANSAGTGVAPGQSGAGTKINFTAAPRIGAAFLARDCEAKLEPQGRITFASATPLMTANVAGATSHYYTNAKGGTCPVTQDGAKTFTDYLFAEVSQLLSDTTKSPAAAIPNAIYDVYAWMDGVTFRVTRSDYWKKAATVTMTIASPCVVSWPGSDFADGTPFVPTTTGALATGLTAGTTYYVKRTGAFGTPTATFNLAATVGGAAINTSGSQSGTHTGTAGDDQGSVARAVSGNCEIDFTKRFPVNKNAITNGPAALYGTWLGTIRTNSSGTLDFILGGLGTGGVAGSIGAWNAYQRAQIETMVGDNDAGAGYNLTSTSWQRSNNWDTMRVSQIRGLDVDGVDCKSVMFTIAGAGTAVYVGFGINESPTPPPSCITGTSQTAGSLNILTALFCGLIGLGWRSVRTVEIQSTATSSFMIGKNGNSQCGFNTSLWY